MKKIILCLLTLTMLFFVGCKSEPAEWLTDFDQATLAAEESGKDLLVLFTAIGYDGYSEEFISTILTQEKFLIEAGKNFVPVQINLIMDESNLSEEEIIKNQENVMIAYSLGLQGFPTVIAASSDVIPYGSFSYDTDTQNLSGCINKVKELVATGEKMQKLNQKLEKASGVEKAKIIDELYNLVPETYSYQFNELIREFPSLDPENKTGKLGFYKLLCAFEESNNIFSESGDIQAATQVFLDLAESGLLNAEEYQHAYYMAAYIECGAGQIVTENTLPYLQKAYDAAPDSDIADSILQTINAIKAMNEETAPETTGEAY